jgi:hypothetical protein
MAKPKAKEVTEYRETRRGRFVSPTYAAANPSTTVHERTKVGLNPRKKGALQTQLAKLAAMIDKL